MQFYNPITLLFYFVSKFLSLCLLIAWNTLPSSISIIQLSMQILTLTHKSFLLIKQVVCVKISDIYSTKVNRAVFSCYMKLYYVKSKNTRRGETFRWLGARDRPFLAQARFNTIISHEKSKYKRYSRYICGNVRMGTT